MSEDENMREENKKVENKKKLRPYVRPEIKKVRLDAEVLLSASCKTTVGSKNGICKTKGVPMTAGC